MYAWCSEQFIYALFGAKIKITQSKWQYCTLLQTPIRKNAFFVKFNTYLSISCAQANKSQIKPKHTTAYAENGLLRAQSMYRSVTVHNNRNIPSSPPPPPKQRKLGTYICKVPEEFPMRIEWISSTSSSVSTKNFNMVHFCPVMILHA
jgi:hypothetical protein